MAERYRGLLVDFGGVLTTSMGRAFSEFCVESGVDPERFKTVIAEAYGADRTHGMIGKLERGEIELDEFETWLAEHLSEGLAVPFDARTTPASRRDSSRTAGARAASATPSSTRCSTPCSSRVRSGCASPTRRSSSTPPS